MFFSLSLSFSPPLGAHPSLWPLYEASIDESKGTFRCFDGSRTISLTQLNDNYGDCDDLSDEPGTGLNHSATFYCRNEFGKPQEIPFWSVGDGICDCLDGSDEFFNSRVNCPNECLKIEQIRINTVTRLKSLYTTRYGTCENYRKKASDLATKAAKKISEGQARLMKLKHEREQIRSNELLKRPFPRDPPALKGWVKSLYQFWRFTFRVPRWETCVFKSLADKRTHENDLRIRETRGQMHHYNEVAVFREGMDKAYAVLAGKEFSAGDWKIRFLKSIWRGDEEIGMFLEEGIENGMHVYGDEGKRVECLLQCGPKDELVRVNETGENQWEAMFASPMFCNEEQAKKLDNMTYEEVGEVAKLFGVKMRAL